MTTESPDSRGEAVPAAASARRLATATSGPAARDGELRFLRCQVCGYWIHPPIAASARSACRRTSRVEAVSGQATLHTFTVNHQPWYPGLDPPYVIAIVELPEQEGLRLTTNIVGCAPDDVEIGMPVQVTFEQLRGRLAPALRAGAMSVTDDGFETERGHQRHRPVRRRPAPPPRSARAHARRVPRGDRRRRPHARRHRRHRDLPGRRCDTPPGFSGVGVDRRARRAAAEPQLVRRAGSSRRASSARSSTRAWRSRPASPTTCCASARVWEGSAQGDKGRAAVMPGFGGGGRPAGCRASAASCSGRCRTARRRPRTGSR